MADVNNVVFYRVTDFLNKLSPPTDNDDGLGDLVGRACYEVGWVSVSYCDYLAKRAS